MMLSEHKGALDLSDCLFTRPGLPGHQTTLLRGLGCEQCR